LGHFFTAPAVGAIIKAAMIGGANLALLQAYEYTDEQENEIRADYNAWLAKAEELEKMK